MTKEEIIAAIKEIATRIPIVFPAHPRTQKRLQEFDLDLPAPVIAGPAAIRARLSQPQSNVFIIPPKRGAQ